MSSSVDDMIHNSPVPIVKSDLPDKVKGLYVESRNKKAILINRSVKRADEERCIIAEELGHYYTSSGNILDQENLNNRKQEQLARSWAYQHLIPLSKIVQAYRDHISGKHDLAEYLNVTEDFLEAAIERYKQKYGVYTTYQNYIIYFDPLGVVESIE